MADEQPSLHIDTDWKKQAQEEKKRLAEQEQKKAAEAAASAGPAPGRRPSAGGRTARELPPPGIPYLINTLLTQALLYLGDLAPQGQEPMLNLDMAKLHIDTLGVLEAKTKGNLTEDEQRLLDNALYELRTRYVQVAAQFV